MLLKNKIAIATLFLLLLNSCAKPSKEMLDNYSVNYELQKEMDKQYQKFALFRSYLESKRILEKSKTSGSIARTMIFTDDEELLHNLSELSEKELLIILICKVSKLESYIKDK